MRRTFARACLLAALVLTVGNVTAQSSKLSFVLGRLRLPSAEDLVEQVGSEADTRTVVSMLLQQELNRSQGIKVDRVRLFRAQVRPDWLPSVDGLKIDLLSDDQARAVYADCALFFTLQPAVVRNGVITMSVTVGNQCHYLSAFYEYRRTAKGWEGGLLPAGAGGGTSECGCSA